MAKWDGVPRYGGSTEEASMTVKGIGSRYKSPLLTIASGCGFTTSAYALIVLVLASGQKNVKYAPVLV